MKAMSISPLVGHSVHTTFCSKARYLNDYMKITRGFSWSLKWVLLVLVTPWSFMQHCQVNFPLTTHPRQAVTQTNDQISMKLLSIFIVPIVLILLFWMTPFPWAFPRCQSSGQNVNAKESNGQIGMKYDEHVHAQHNMITLPNFIGLVDFPPASSEHTLHF